MWWHTTFRPYDVIGLLSFEDEHCIRLRLPGVPLDTATNTASIMAAEVSLKLSLLKSTFRLSVMFYMIVESYPTTASE